ncbi:hypothetical protein LTR17_003858 [Elasticomyces elasticus]|nr:hypothetical protein LTR17_003858 [Elasticomyces elasticus]
MSFSSKLTIGNRDATIMLPKPRVYESQVEASAQISVLFYDVQAKRGWMINGTDALLHLSRAYLSSPYAAPAQNEFDAQLVQQFEHRRVVGGKWQTARDVLCNPRNRKIRICPPESGDELTESEYEPTFEELVLHFYAVLSEIEAWAMTLKDRRTTEVAGFGFADIVSRSAVLNPRVAKLEAASEDWMKIVNETKAVVILGTGFGDLRSKSSSSAGRVRSVADARLGSTVTLVVPKAQGLSSTHQTPIEMDVGLTFVELTDEASDASSNVSASNVSSARESYLRHGSNSVGTMPTTIESRTAAGRDDTTSAAGEPENDEDDLRSIRTDAQDIGASIGQDQRKELAARFANELLDNLDPDDITEEVLATMPEMLLDFSKVLDHKAKRGVQQKASVFVRHHRKNIVTFARERLANDVRTLQTDVEKLDITSWAANVSGDEEAAACVPLDFADLPELDAFHHHDDDLPADIGQARVFLLMGTEFQWLLNRIKTTATTIETGAERLRLHNDVLRLVTGRRSTFKVEVDWNPLQFLQQQYDNVPSATIGTSITYNGTDDLVEAIGCKDYICRNWPTYGEQVLSCVEHLVLDKMAHEPSAQSTVGAQNAMLELSLRGGKLLASVKGDLLASVETVEVLSWLGTACRASPEPDRPMYCSALITDDTGGDAVRITFNFVKLPDMVPHETPARILGTTRGTQASPPTGSSHCWSQLVRNPAVAKGYPVSRRHNDEKGLEIDLGLMTQLAKAHRVITVDGLLMIKSFCSMFVAVAEASGSVLWHYILAANYCPVSYSEARQYCKLLTPVIYGTLPHARHFVGLSQLATILTGTKNANYDIGFTGKNFAGTGFAIKDLTLGVSKIVALSAKVVPGHKDARLALSKPKCFELEMGYIRSTRVLFYDTEEKRGWLVDGHDALLHLSRAYLSSPFAPPAENGFAADLVKQFRHRSVANGRWQTSSEVLCNPDNLRIRVGHTYQPSGDASDQDSIYKSKATSGMRFEDVVLNKLEVLRDMIAHQEYMKKSGEDQFDIKNPLARQQIVGFGFADIMSLHQKLRPRFADLKLSGPVWTELTDEMEAMCILGCGFGDLLGTAGDCRKCTGVPPQYEFLTTTARILRLTEEANGISWNLPDPPSQPKSCQCTPLSHGIRCGVAITELRSCRALKNDRSRAYKGKSGISFDGLFVIGREQDIHSAKRAMQRASLRCIACEDCQVQELIHEPDISRHQSALSLPDHSTSENTPLSSSTTNDSGYVTGMNSSASTCLSTQPPAEISQTPMAILRESASKRAPSLTDHTDAPSGSRQSDPDGYSSTRLFDGHNDRSSRHPTIPQLLGASDARSSQVNTAAIVCDRVLPGTTHAPQRILETSGAMAAGLSDGQRSIPLRALRRSKGVVTRM